MSVAVGVIYIYDTYRSFGRRPKSLCAFERWQAIPCARWISWKRECASQRRPELSRHFEAPL